MSESRGSAITVLVVDDVEANLFALEELLKGNDLRLLKARSGREALELLLKESVALALIDVQMPEIDGFELARLMRGAQRSRDIPIIFITGAESDVARTFKGYEAGAVDFIYKPLVPEVLRSKIDVFVRLARQQAQLTAQLQELQQALRMNELFTAALGHDLRQPLHAITAGLEVLEHYAPHAEARQVIARLMRSSKRMEQMISQLLDVARLRAGTFALRLGEVDLHALLNHVIAEAGTPSKRSVTLDVAGDVRGFWDAVRLGQVFANLVGNALIHGADQVRISVDGNDPAEVRVAVANGGAINSKLLPHIFEPFRTSGDHGGTGLGLYIVKSMVERHGGDVLVSSTPLTGTLFRIRLPRALPAALQDRARATPAATSS